LDRPRGEAVGRFAQRGPIAVVAMKDVRNLKPATAARTENITAGECRVPRNDSSRSRPRVPTCTADSHPSPLVESIWHFYCHFIVTRDEIETSSFSCLELDLSPNTFYVHSLHRGQRDEWIHDAQVVLDSIQKMALKEKVWNGDDQ
jgi:hypothetical protein